ncbi:unnamed protein product [Lactuca saligna]|uniref:Uncharacterized protein n=1 Tax=Lactuca saligna TaxID=75948 RepID=A0AA35ZKG8_LACSI|nr:unnamed protein product [Lactuca saligna]
MMKEFLIIKMIGFICVESSKSGLPPKHVERYNHMLTYLQTQSITLGVMNLLRLLYADLENHIPEPIVGSTNQQPLLDAPGDVFQLRKLLPTSLPYDFNIHFQTEKKHLDCMDVLSETHNRSSDQKIQIGANPVVNCEWKPLDKELYVKGLDIFGRNCCLITRNLLCGLKTCIEVANYMYEIGAETSLKACSMLDGNERVDANAQEGKQIALELEEEKKAQTERDKMLQMQVLHFSFQLLL